MNPLFQLLSHEWRILQEFDVCLNGVYVSISVRIIISKHVCYEVTVINSLLQILSGISAKGHLINLSSQFRTLGFQSTFNNVVGNMSTTAVFVLNI